MKVYSLEYLLALLLVICIVHIDITIKRSDEQRDDTSQ